MLEALHQRRRRLCERLEHSPRSLDLSIGQRGAYAMNRDVPQTGSRACVLWPCLERCATGELGLAQVTLDLGALARQAELGRPPKGALRADDEVERAAVATKGLDQAAKRLRRHEALGRLVVHRLRYDVDELSRRVGTERRDDPLARTRSAVSLARGRVRRPSAEQLVERRAEQVDVRPRSEGLGVTFELLGSHVRERPRDRSALDVREVGVRVLAPERGDPPVEQVDLSEVTHHHVGRLDVPMDHAALVRIRQRIADRAEDTQVPVERVVGAEARTEDRRLVHHVCPELALDLLEDDLQLAGVPLDDLVHRDDVRMLEARGETRFLEQAMRARRRLVTKRLHRDGAAEVRLDAVTDGPHSSFAKGRPHFEPRGPLVHRAPARLRLGRAGRTLDAGLDRRGDFARTFGQREPQRGPLVELALELGDLVLGELAPHEPAQPRIAAGRHVARLHGRHGRV